MVLLTYLLALTLLGIQTPDSFLNDKFRYNYILNLVIVFVTLIKYVRGLRIIINNVEF
jgi:hypothetical protein